MSEVEALQRQLKDAEAFLENRDAAQRLYKNPDFKKLILDGFCQRDCARYVQESQDPALTPSQQADALHMAQAAGHLRRYLSIQVQLGNHAETQMEGIREALAELRADEGAD